MESIRAVFFLFSVAQIGSPENQPPFPYFFRKKQVLLSFHTLNFGGIDSGFSCLAGQHMFFFFQLKIKSRMG